MTAGASTTTTPPRPRLRAVIELGLFLLVLCVPLLGVWAASSLAAYSNGSRGAAIALGALVFPVIPVAWELVAEVRRRRRKLAGPRILTLADRMTLRTLVTSLALLVPMVVMWPAELFQALTTRGDWFLDGVEADWAPIARTSVLGAADGLVWIYDATHENPWREDGGESTGTGGTGPGPMPSGDEMVVEGPSDESDPTPVTGTPAPVVTRTPTVTPTPAVTPTPVASPTRWPWLDELHPLAHAPPPAAEASVEALGAYFRGAVQDPTERARLVHDWVADHIAYDAPSYAAHVYPPQTADAAFTTRLAVCAGYARLFEALGDAAGLHVETVVGDARTGSGEPEGHAWNAIEIDGVWWLVDTTWDAGSVSGTEFTRRYRSAHFLAPPEVMGVTHFPDEPRWQLRDPPLTRGEWNRQPILRPEFFAAGLRLVSPDRARIDAGPHVDARVESDGEVFLLASAEPEGGGARTECRIRGNRTFDIGCDLPAPGSWTIHIFSSPVPYGTYWGVGSFAVTYR